MRYSEDQRHSEEGIFVPHGLQRPFFPLRDRAEVAGRGEAGRFVWHLLYTPSAQESIRFYKALFGWQAVEPSGGETVRLEHPHGDEIGSLIQLRSDQDLPPQWVPGLAVGDAGDAAGQARRLGADVPVADERLESGRRLSLLRDPQGAILLAVESDHSGPAARDVPPGPPGGFTWHELVSPEPEASERFYRELIDWQTQERDLGEGVSYRMLGNRERPAAGLLPAAGADTPAFWLSYLQVPDVDHIAEHIEALGGRVLAKPTALPEGTRYAIVNDPHGATLGVVEPNPSTA
jgi:hypothetical protein